MTANAGALADSQFELGILADSGWSFGHLMGF
jgi:hypothetical protein